MAKILLDTDVIEATITSINSLIERFNTQLTKMNTGINAIPYGWTGDDATAFLGKAKTYHAELSSICDAIVEYNGKIASDPTTIIGISTTNASKATQS